MRPDEWRCQCLDLANMAEHARAYAENLALDAIDAGEVAVGRIRISQERDHESDRDLWRHRAQRGRV